MAAVFGSPKRTTVVQSCTGAGKSHIAAHIAWAWLMSGPDRLVVTTAPSQRQVNGAIWSEMRSIERRARAMGQPLGGKLAPKAAEYSGVNGRRATGYSTDSATNFAGWHSAGGTLVILDDAQGVDDETWDTILNTVTGTNDRILAIANPLEPSGRFFELCKTRGEASVNRIGISAFDTPNVVAGRTVIDGLVTIEQIENIRDVYGEDSAVWKSRVLGEFPDASNDLCLVPLSWLVASANDYNAWASTIADGAAESITMAADLAGLGRDSGVTSVVRDYLARDARGIPVRLRHALPLIVHPKFPVENTMGTVGYLVGEHRRIRPDSFRVDKVGLGQGIFDRLVELGVPTVGMSGGRAASDKRFANERAEVLHGLRDALRPRASDGGADARPRLLVPWNDRLVQQATTLRMSFTSSGQHKVESKADWSARQTNKGARGSPDELDALAMAVCGVPSGDDESIEGWLKAYG